MPRKAEPSFSLKQIIWDVAATVGTDNFDALYREIDRRLEELRRRGEVFEDTPDKRKARDIIELDIQRLQPEVVVAKLPRHVWHLRNDYEAIIQLASEKTEAKPQRAPIDLAPHIQKAVGEHLDEIRNLIVEWRSSIHTPEIFQVSLDYAGNIPCEDKLLFVGVREHLPFPELWQCYTSWRMRRAEYIDTCKTLRKQIIESWVTGGVVMAPSFERPILRLISGIDKELRYELHVELGRGLAEVEYQLLLAGDHEVVRGHELVRGREYPPNLRKLKHEQCNKETLPAEYDKIAGNFLRSEAANRVKQLLLDTGVLEAEVRRSLEIVLAQHTYANHICKLCPG
jgi:hypothetical protein